MDLLETRVYGLIGEAGFARLTSAFYRRVEGDEVLGPMYRASLAATGETMSDAEGRLRDFLVGRFGGPPRYEQRRGHPRLRARHLRFAIDEAAARRWIAAMEASMAEAELPAEAAGVLRPFFEQFALFMVNRGGAG